MFSLFKVAARESLSAYELFLIHFSSQLHSFWLQHFPLSNIISILGSKASHYLSMTRFTRVSSTFFFVIFVDLPQHSRSSETSKKSAGYDNNPESDCRCASECGTSMTPACDSVPIRFIKTGD